MRPARNKDVRDLEGGSSGDGSVVKARVDKASAMSQGEDNRFWDVILFLLLFLVSLMLYNEIVRHYKHRQQVGYAVFCMFLCPLPTPLTRLVNLHIDPRGTLAKRYIFSMLPGVLGRSLSRSGAIRQQRLEVRVATRGS